MSRATLSDGRVVESTDNLLGRLNGLVGGKTGHTSDAGWSQAAFARKGGVGITAVVLGSPTEAQRDGDLAALLRGYVVQNGLQPYADPGIRDPRLWTELALAADHAAFIDLISRYIGEHPSTKTTTELLFLLDAMVQGSYDALTTLLDVVPAADLEWTRASNADAIRAIVTIQKHYREELERRGLTSRDAIRLYFDEARLSILTNIIATTPRGYRAGDAQVIVGSIYWRQGRTDDAVDVWKRMTVDREGVHARMASEILDAIRGRDVRQLDIRSVNRAIDGDQSRWVSTSYERLRQFGFHFNTY
jgi:hypothetical protein